jgi:hypothetical protein
MPTAVVMLVAVIVPVMSVLAIWSLFLGLRDLEQSSDDLVELRRRAPSTRPTNGGPHEHPFHGPQPADGNDAA